jgi:hypothetical protein
MKKTTIALFSLFFSSNLINAQEFVVPKEYVLVAKEDYSKYEKDIIACANWMETSPLDKDKQKRLDANAFMMKWLTGSPTVNVSIINVVSSRMDTIFS